TVLVPWMVFSTVLLTEVLGYPVFLWAILACQRALVKASPGADAVAAAAILAATATRPQFLVLAPVLVVAAVGHVAGRALAAPGARSRSRAVGFELAHAARAHWLGFGLTAAGLLTVPLVQRILGTYGGLLEEALVPPGAVALAVDQLAVIAVGCGLVPLVVGSAWALATLIRPASAEAHAFAMLAIVTVAGLCLVAASFDLNSGGGILFDRYAFYAAPVMLVAMGAGLADGRRTTPALPVGAGVAALVVMSYDFVPYALPWFVSPASVFHVVLEGRAGQIGSWLGVAKLNADVLLVSVAILAAVVVVVCGHRRSPPAAVVIGLPLAVFLLAQTVYVFRHLGIETQPALHRGQDWVDGAVDDATVASVPGAISQQGTGTVPYWDLEFWNKTVARQLSYQNSQAHHTELGSGQLAVNPDDGSLQLSESVRYLALPEADRRFMPAGRRLAHHAGLALIDIGSRPRAAWVINGTDSEAGWVPEGGTGLVDLYGDANGAQAQRVSLSLVPPPGQSGRRRVAVRDGARRIAGVVMPRRPRELAVTVCFAGEPRRRLTVTFDGATRLPSGQRVGGAILTARTAAAGPCRR
ncbi:MAG: hypothetical protein H0V22_06685, partial [Solirubrobacterales bacterium]|nr:hypothetical protein [Solirubrobacterales bacterium]